MIRTMRRVATGGCALAIALGAMPGSGAAEESFKGQTVRVITGFPAGSASDPYGRAVARHIGRFLPGHPNAIAVNVPGAGSLKAANYIYNVAPKDGTVFGMVASAMLNEDLLGNPAAEYDAEKFNWIGRFASFFQVTTTWHTSKVKTIQDAMTTEVAIGGTGAGSGASLQPEVLSRVLGVKFKMINGYESSTAALVAMERGEVDGSTNGWGTIAIAKADWLRDHKVNVLVQYGLKRHADIPNVPTSVELATNAEQRQLLALYASAGDLGKSYMAPPGVPPERVRLLRTAFDAMVRDADFIAEVKKQGLDYDPLPGQDIENLILDRVKNTSPEVLEKARRLFQN
jgi:tripartite-type tricarboxylate transporter receptor subunit TctC